ncbi:YgaP-like transmembrane domain [Asticcacaulis biprosthecium]|uniref:YgaP-like transmembrane domain n=1 Tax=Asticcacaulis biprosthecium TaxID=76891 RepID=UPI00030D42F0|nr:YgaP-like transmembrane domain [Asticcacaulis biprosthecium]
MLYQKNLFAWESVLRIALGLAAAVAGFLLIDGLIWKYAAVAAGAGIALTGVVGFCPMCALVGRKPVRKDH